MNRTFLFVFILFSSRALPQQRIEIDPGDSGRTYEGIGALSAGASSRLLIDYPEPYRGQILDFLFKPGFGASLEHLKVEIGGDVNSTSGSEPSHARTRKEFENPRNEYFQRGYEWWLMQEARKRNPNIFLDCLEWGAPGWIGDGKYYSDDNIHYIISFIKGAKQYYDVDINFTGIWNERMYDVEFIKNLRKQLDANGLRNVRIIAADLCCQQQWKIADDMKIDKELFQSVSVIGDHYPERDDAYNSSDNAKNLGVPVWNSEGGPWRGDWPGFRYLARMYNRDYIEGRMTKNITWSLITSYYENLSLPNSGLMTANTPWSGFFEVEPALWAVAHTTQFAEPGWKYIDAGCGYLTGDGSFVTLASTDAQNLSIIIETMDAKKVQTIRFKINGHVNISRLKSWKTVAGGQFFEQLPDVKAVKNEFTFSLDADALYSFTTTTGQKRGAADPPDNNPFPFPYETGFEEGKPGTTPKYFSDQGGSFEIAMGEDQGGKCLRQVITRKAIEWEEGEIFNQTVLGDTSWNDYTVSCDVYFREPYSYSTVLARVTEMYRSHKAPEAYAFKLCSSGKWQLLAGARELATGMISCEIKKWNRLSLETRGNTIRAWINGRETVKITDSSYTHGIAGLGSSFNEVDFDNFSIK